MLWGVYVYLHVHVCPLSTVVWWEEKSRRSSWRSQKGASTLCLVVTRLSSSTVMYSLFHQSEPQFRMKVCVGVECTFICIVVDLTYCILLHVYINAVDVLCVCWVGVWMCNLTFCVLLHLYTNAVDILCVCWVGVWTYWHESQSQEYRDWDK